MNILFAASEVAPYIKTGGLADVAGSLPQKLADMGHDVKVILPLYERIGAKYREKMQLLHQWQVSLAWRSPYCGLLEIREGNISYLFVDNEYYFKREEVYGHYDDGERFAFFSRAVIECAAQLDWHPDIIHANDWETALVPVYLLEERQRCWQLHGTRSVYTIHNIEYQGRYGQQMVADVFGLSAGYLNEQMLAYHGDVNMMKGAIYAADYVTTVSPTYAGELQYPFYAHGLEGVITHNQGKMKGIINGLDVGLYDPKTDRGLVQDFDVKSMKGKAVCKLALQQAVGLNPDPNVPIIACVSRLVKHKGFGLIAQALHAIMGMHVQMVVLGTGDWAFEEAFRHAEAQYPGRFAARIQYSASLSAAIYGGADMLLMPSLAEPCGLAQMIAMRYGTVPIVRETGGLRDTVRPFGIDDSTGFTFADINAKDMVWVIGQAVGLYADKDAWKAIQQRGMTTDFSWQKPAAEYEEIYYQLSGALRPEEILAQEAARKAEEAAAAKLAAEKAAAEQAAAERAVEASKAARPAPAAEPAAKAAEKSAKKAAEKPAAKLVKLPVANNTKTPAAKLAKKAAAKKTTEAKAPAAEPATKPAALEKKTAPAVIEKKPAPAVIEKKPAPAVIEKKKE